MPKKKKTTKGRKGRKRRPGNSKVLWIVCFLFLGGVSFFAALFLPEQEGPPRTRLEYEEAHIEPSRIREYIGLIDHAVYEVLYKRRIVEKDIFFTDVGHRSNNGDIWDFTEITVRLPDDAGRRYVLSELLSEIEALGPPVECWMDAEPSSEIAFRVYVVNRITHRIRLVLSETPPFRHFSKHLPKVAIIIDDLGYDLDIARAFMSLGIPLTLSLLPMAPYTGDIAGEAGRNGFEVMIHVPMEPEGFPELDPGPGALLNSMGPEEIRSLVLQHLDDVPDAKGVNNHMGSSFTERQDKVAAFLEEVRKKGLYFVDSKTSAQSVAYFTAREMGVPATSRNVFLDSEPSAAAISIQLERLLGLAKQHGEAVGIGHPFPETLKILKRQAGRLKTEFQVVTVSELVR